MNIHIIKRQYSEIISVREKKGSIMKEFFSMGKTMKKLISVVMSLALLLTSAGVIFSAWFSISVSDSKCRPHRNRIPGVCRLRISNYRVWY